MSAAPFGLIFDLDGTLVDSAPDIHAAANAALAAEGFPELDLATVRSFIGGGVPLLVQALLRAAGGDPAPEGDDYRRLYATFAKTYEDAVHLTRLFPHVTETLARLHAEGHRVAICTNKPIVPARATLAHFGLDAHIEALVAGDTLAVRKPDPAPVLLALERIGGGRAVYIGDGEADAKAARAAGLPFGLFTEGYRKTSVEALSPDFAFSDYAALPALLDARARA